MGILRRGAWGRPVLGFDGEEFTEFGLQFLVEVNKWVNKKEKEVLVVGGGNVSWTWPSAKRLGAASVTLACLEQRDEMRPRPKGRPRRGRGVKIINGFGVKRALYEGERLTGMELKKCVALRDETGRFNPSYDEGETLTLEADSVLMAAGQRVDLSFIEEKYELAKNRGLIKVEAETQRTSRPNVFAGGDMTTGPTTVIKAIRSGRNAAEAINAELGLALPEKDTQHGFIRFAEGCAAMKEAVKDRQLSAAERALDREDSFTSPRGGDAARRALHELRLLFRQRLRPRR
ncbi:MAG: FAD-dependent oxidoreductase [Cloacibacillus evryensis]